MGLIITAGIATALNLIFVKWKFEHERYLDGLLDVSMLIILSILFSGTMSGLSIAMIASAVWSIYLYNYPPSWNFSDEEENGVF